MCCDFTCKLKQKEVGHGSIEAHYKGTLFTIGLQHGSTGSAWHGSHENACEAIALVECMEVAIPIKRIPWNAQLWSMWSMGSMVGSRCERRMRETCTRVSDQCMGFNGEEKVLGSFGVSDNARDLMGKEKVLGFFWVEPKSL